MFRVDIPKLKGKMAERSYTITALSQELGISRNTMRTYLNKPETMPYRVVNRMALLLCDNASEASCVFFSHDLRDA